jgi:hypothetical protein
VDGVRNSVEFTEKNIRTDLDAMQDKEKISEKLGGSSLQPHPAAPGDL